MPSINDVIVTKLRARYPAMVSASINDLLAKYLKDNPTMGHLLGVKAHYSQTSSESHADAMSRFWAAFVP